MNIHTRSHSRIKECAKGYGRCARLGAMIVGRSETHVCFFFALKHTFEPGPYLKSCCSKKIKSFIIRFFLLVLRHPEENDSSPSSRCARGTISQRLLFILHMEQTKMSSFLMLYIFFIDELDKCREKKKKTFLLGCPRETIVFSLLPLLFQHLLVLHKIRHHVLRVFKLVSTK